MVNEKFLIPGVVNNVRFAPLPVGVFEIILFTPSCLNVHVPNVEIKSTRIILPFFIHLICPKNRIQISCKIFVKFTLFGLDYIFSKENSSLIIFGTTEDVNYTFLRESSIKGWINLFAGFAFDINISTS